MRCLAVVGSLVGALGIGCGAVSETPVDAPPAPEDAAVDAPIDAATCPRTLLDGSAMVEPQGWSVVSMAPSALTYGPDYVRLETSTSMDANTSGMLLLHYPGALEPPPFRIEYVVLIERVNTHNQFDAGAAILASFTPPFGAGNDRSQMVYLDAGRVGWTDDSQSAAATIGDNAYHTIVLAMDAAGAMQVTLDGAMVLARVGFTTNGAIAIGDQTNDRNVDSAMRIRSIKQLCP